MATNLNVLKCNYNEVKEIVINCLDLKQAVLIHGAPGIGKSALPVDICKDKNKVLKKRLSLAEYKKQKWKVVDIRLAQFPPEDMAGIPVPVEVTKEGKKHWVTLRSLPDFLPTSGNGILFLDEINQANNAVLAAVFQLILDRKMASYTLPEGWSIVAACNDFKYNSDVTEFNSPINDRFIHLEMILDASQWLNWAKDNDINDKVRKFIKKNPSLLCDEENMNDNIVFSSPRSWVKVSDWQNLQDEGKISLELLTTVVSGIVGLEIGSQYMNINNNYEFDFEAYVKLLKSPKDESLGAILHQSGLGNTNGYTLLDNCMTTYLDYSAKDDDEDSTMFYNISRIAFNVNSNKEFLITVWARLYEQTEDQFTSYVKNVKDDYPDAWENIFMAAG